MGAYGVYFLSQVIGLNLELSFLLSIVFAAVVGSAMYFSVYAPLMKRNSPSMVLLIASIGLYTILQNCISLFFGDKTKSIRSWDVVAGYTLGDATITKIQLIISGISFVVFICISGVVLKSKLGMQMRALSSNRALAGIFGVDAKKTTFWLFAIGSGMAALSGMLISLDTDMTPRMGFSLLLYGVVAMIIGGVGSNLGLIGGALLLATAQHMGAYYFDSKWMDSISYIILVIFLIWKPLGFSGQQLKKTEI